MVIYSCLGYREERRQAAQSHERCFLVGASEQERQDVERGCRGDSSSADEYVADDRHEGFEIDARCDGGSIEAMLTTFAGVNSSNEPEFAIFRARG